MPWTRDTQLKYLIALPWTITVGQSEDGDRTAEVAELPAVLATGGSESELARDLYEAIWAQLDAMLEHGDAVPLPAGAHLPWERGEEPRPRNASSTVPWKFDGDAWLPTATAISDSRAIGLK